MRMYVHSLRIRRAVRAGLLDNDIALDESHNLAGHNRAARSAFAGMLRDAATFGPSAIQMRHPATLVAREQRPSLFDGRGTRRREPAEVFAVGVDVLNGWRSSPGDPHLEVVHRHANTPLPDSGSCFAA